MGIATNIEYFKSEKGISPLLLKPYSSTSTTLLPLSTSTTLLPLSTSTTLLPLSTSTTLLPLSA